MNGLDILDFQIPSLLIEFKQSKQFVDISRVSKALKIFCTIFLFKSSQVSLIVRGGRGRGEGRRQELGSNSGGAG